MGCKGNKMTIEKTTSYSIGSTKLLTPYEVAKILKVNPSLVRRYCRQGRLGTLYGKAWFITEAELEAFRAIPRKRGNPEFGKR